MKLIVYFNFSLFVKDGMLYYRIETIQQTILNYNVFLCY
jgi:hypothetical protein